MVLTLHLLLLFNDDKIAIRDKRQLPIKVSSVLRHMNMKGLLHIIRGRFFFGKSRSAYCDFYVNIK